MREGAHGETNLDSQRRLAARNLKRCTLCGAINAMANGECFVCRWHGTFDTDPVAVDEGLGELLDQCPELADAMLVSIPERKPTIWHRVKHWFCELFFAERSDSHMQKR
jgi:hypothetical protein